MDGFCFIDTKVLLRNGWISTPVHLAYIELHAMFRALTCPRPEEAFITRERYWSTVLGSLEVIVKLLEPMHELDASEPAVSQLRQASSELPTCTESMMTAADSETPEAKTTGSVDACGPRSKAPTELSDKLHNPWLMTVPPEPEKRLVKLDGCVFDLGDDEVLLHLSEHISRPRPEKTAGPAAGAEANRRLTRHPRCGSRLFSPERGKTGQYPRGVCGCRSGSK